MSNNEVVLVFNESGQFYDVYPKISKSLQEMRDKIIGIKGVKWEWHVVLTFDNPKLNEILKSGGMSGTVLLGFLNRTRTMYRTDRKYFWKYEEGGDYGRSHFHMLLEFRKQFTKEYIAKKMYKAKWEAGAVDIQKRINKQKGFRMNKRKTDTEIMMGMWLRRKWGNGVVYAKQIRIKRQSYQQNIVYYINKDLMKPTGFQYFKKSARKWGFGRGYQFDAVSMFKYIENVSVDKCVHKILSTQDYFMKYYDSYGKDGYRFMFKKIRDIKNGKYFKTIE